MRCIFALAICVLVLNVCFSEPDDFRQESAKVLYTNPKYIRYLKVYTIRHTRNSPYLTTANVSNWQPWDNNITLVVDCYTGTRQLFSFDFKLCEFFKVSWAKEWLSNFTDVPLRCPIPVGEYHFNELQIPPKNFPIPLSGSDYSMGLHVFVGKTKESKEKVADLKINLRFQTKKKNAG